MENLSGVPLISVVVPVYNVEEYLPRCIESMTAQTHRNLEIILIDDGSTDDGGRICDEYAGKDSRIRVIHQPNAGVSAARNAGLDAARGEWIGFVDSDDWIEPDMYEKLLKAALDSGKDIAACGLYAHMLDGTVTKGIFKNAAGAITRIDALEHVIMARFHQTMYNLIYRRDMIEKESPLRCELGVANGEDSLFLAGAFARSNGIFYLPEALYRYCVRAGSVSQTFTDKQPTSIYAKERLVEVASGVSKRTERLAKFRHMDTAVYYINLSVRNKKYEYLPKLRKAARRYAFEYFTAKELNFPKKLRNAMVLLFPRFTNMVWGWMLKRFNLKALIAKLNKK